MDTQGYQQAKYRVIARDLERRLREGSLRFNECFFTREELARKYKVSPLTAHKVLKLLETDGILSCGRGRRAKLLIATCAENWVPDQRVRVLICVPDDANGTPSTGCMWLTTYLKNILRQHGHTVSVCTPDECRECQKTETADAVLLLDDPAPDAVHLKWLPGQEKPYVRLSFRYPAENTIYLMPQPFLDGILLHLIRRNAERIVFIHGGDSPLEHLLCCPQVMTEFEAKFRQYRKHGKVEHAGPLNLDDPDSESALRALLAEAKKIRTGLICGNELLGKEISELAEKSEAILIRSCFAMEDQIDYPVIDLDLQSLGDEMISMLYRQLNSRTVYDAGALHIPQFHARPFYR